MRGQVTLPLSMPGIIAGCLLVFIPAIGEYVIPALLGGADTLMIGRVLFDEFFLNRDWPVASAVAIVLLLLLVLPIVYFQKKQAQERKTSATLHFSKFPAMVDQPRNEWPMDWQNLMTLLHMTMASVCSDCTSATEMTNLRAGAHHHW